PMPVSRDAIGEILRTGQASVAGDKAVLAAQRALNRLGYGPIKPDGIFGAGTRQAIEKFERDRKLPVTGEVNPRTAKELATASGLAD
ncbi:peptidoglycan-binding domain-containing protein, partial [Nostoc sp. NIES-2111]